MLRRMRGFDYASPGYYFVTLMLSDHIPRLSKISGRAFKPLNGGKADAKSNTIYPILSPETDIKYGPKVDLNMWGEVVYTELYALQDKFPVSVKSMVIMPDHIHLLLLVTEYNPRKLGGIISAFKGCCSREFWNANPQFKDKSFWKKGYNDRPVILAGQLSRFINYIYENPRKYLIRKSIPQYFYNRWQFEFNGERYHAIGNIFLLMHPVRVAIRFSRKYSEHEYINLKKYWYEISVKGDVVISTYIHPEEKAVTKACTAAGAKLIWIKNNGFPERSSVKGEEAYNLCVQGRLLMIAPEKYHTSRQTISRSDCLHLNELAKYICETDILTTLKCIKQ